MRDILVQGSIAHGGARPEARRGGSQCQRCRVEIGCIEVAGGLHACASSTVRCIIRGTEVAGTCVSVASPSRCPRPRSRCALRAHGETVLPVGSGACSGAPHAKFDRCRVEHLVGGASRRDARCSHEWRDCTCLGIQFQIVRRCRTSDGDHRWHVFVKVRVVVSHGYRGQRVREASHPAPVRRLRRSADVRNVFPRLATQSTVADSEVTDVVVPVRASELHVLSDTELRAPVRPSRRGGVGPRARGHSDITSRQLHPTSS